MRCVIFLALLLLAIPSTAPAAFGLILPADDIVSQGESSLLGLQIRLFDPLNQRFLEVPRPQRFGVQRIDEPTDLVAGLKAVQAPKTTAWQAEFAIKRPGDHTFNAELAPRWAAEEEQFIVHHAKLCVNALGLEEGWDEPVGLEAEIVPLSRPYGVWTGNLFSGQVLLNGDPAPYVVIEIAWLGTSPDAPPLAMAPAAPYLVQKVHADANGVFHYAMPRAGWWGFAATLEADWTIRHDGDEKPVTIVTSYWVLARDMK